MGGSFVPNKMHSTFERRTARPLTTPEQQQQRSLSEATLKHKMLYREEEEKAAHRKSQQESRNTDVKDWNADEDSRKRDQQRNKKEKEIPSEASEREREREREREGNKAKKTGSNLSRNKNNTFFPPTDNAHNLYTTSAISSAPPTHTQETCRASKSKQHPTPHHHYRTPTNRIITS
jgi:hypothetical protein